MKLSVIIPAYNAADTLGETLESLLAQTFLNWEAVVVNDGSTDDTVAVARRFANRDRRVRMVSRLRGGLAGARNTGILHSLHPWLLFLDADDWLLPECLERLTRVIADEPGVEAVHCGWTRITPGNRLWPPAYCPQTPDLFAEAARYNPLAVHACAVRRTLIDEVGVFDETLKTCEDWDFWQRLARRGTSFGGVREVLVRYRMRPHSLGTQARQLLVDALRVIERGHAPDPRVRVPIPQHLHGQSKDLLPAARWHFLCWPAGMLLGQGGDARSLLPYLGTEAAPELLADLCAVMLLGALRVSGALLLDELVDLWPRIESRLNEYLVAYELVTKAKGIARRTRTLMERWVLDSSPRRPVTVGSTHAVLVKVNEPVADVIIPAGVERLHCTVTRDRNRLGTVELPAVEPFVSGPSIAEAVFADFPGRKCESPAAAGFTGLPILMYHRVAPTGCPKASRYRVHPSAFAEQMACLSEAGFHTVTLHQLREAREGRLPLSGRPILLTFDDGYLDFLTQAWPVLDRFGFTGLVFLVTDYMGATNAWDRAYGYSEEVPILSWEDVAYLRKRGIAFGSHTASHPRLTGLSPKDILDEGRRSRMALADRLGEDITSIAYPHGDQDRVVQSLMGEAGYTFGLTCVWGACTIWDRLIALPRIEVKGDMTTGEFAAVVDPLGRSAAA